MKNYPYTRSWAPVAISQQGAALLIALSAAMFVSATAFLLIERQSKLTDVVEASALRSIARENGVAAIDRSRFSLPKRGEPFVGPIIVEEESASSYSIDSPPDAHATITIESELGKFNINNIVAAKGKPVIEEIALLERIIDRLGLDPALSTAIVDWVDADELASEGGAESGWYATMSPPYRSANRPVRSIEELRLVKGMTDKVYMALRPYVTALPERRRIDVNAAPPLLLSAIFTGLPERWAQSVVDARKQTPFKSVADFRERLPANVTEVDERLFGVHTDVYRVTALYDLHGVRAKVIALLLLGKRDAPARILWRRIS